MFCLVLQCLRLPRLGELGLKRWRLFDFRAPASIFLFEGFSVNDYQPASAYHPCWPRYVADNGTIMAQLVPGCVKPVIVAVKQQDCKSSSDLITGGMLLIKALAMLQSPYPKPPLVVSSPGLVSVEWVGCFAFVGLGVCGKDIQSNVLMVIFLRITVGFRIAQVHCMEIVETNFFYQIRSLRKDSGID